MEKLETADAEIYYRVRGAGEPIFLLHAYPLDHRAWDVLAEKLAVNYRVITPDLRGFGKSRSKKDANELEIEDFADDVKVLMDNLGIDKAIIGGLSMGGYICFAFAGKYPERLRALILADTTADADTAEQRKKRFENIAKIEKDGFEAIAEDFIKSVLSEKTQKEKPSVVAQVRRFIENVSDAGAIAALKAMAKRPGYQETARKITAPALIIVGENDALTKVEAAQKANAAISFSKLEVISNAGHYSNLETPDEFNLIVFEFVKLLGIR